jgi:predicted transcriptional regulator
MKADGHTGKAIAKFLGVSRATLYRYLDEDRAA